MTNSINLSAKIRLKSVMERLLVSYGDTVTPALQSTLPEKREQLCYLPWYCWRVYGVDSYEKRQLKRGEEDVWMRAVWVWFKAMKWKKLTMLTPYLSTTTYYSCTKLPMSIPKVDGMHLHGLESNDAAEMHLSSLLLFTVKPTSKIGLNPRLLPFWLLPPQKLDIAP